MAIMSALLFGKKFCLEVAGAGPLGKGSGKERGPWWEDSWGSVFTRSKVN